MKKILLIGSIILCAVISGSLAIADDVFPGRWDGTVEIPNKTVGIFITFDGTDKTLSGTIDIPVQTARGLKLVDFTIDGSDIEFKIQDVPGDPTFNGTLSADQSSISGTFSQGGGNFAFVLKKVDPGAEAARLKKAFARLSAYIDTSLVSWNVPGLAIAIVKDGETLFAEGFGCRDYEKKLPVTPQTLFAIGSTTKAMTCACLEMLVEERLIDWDEPVKTYIPDFTLKDEVATARLTVRDLVTHRSGLARHDPMWYGSLLSRRELFNRLRYLDFHADIRTTYQYNNLLYMAAGVLIEEVTGKTWESFITERLHRPLGMNDVLLSVSDMPDSPDHALPYAFFDDKIVTIPYRNIDAIGPAGSVNANITDMAKWLAFNLEQKTADGGELLSKSSFNDIQTIHTPMGATVNPEGCSLGYGLGWVIGFYRNHVRLNHGGGIDGFITSVALYPKDGIGIIVLSNQDSNFAHITAEIAADLVFGLEPHKIGMKPSKKPYSPLKQPEHPSGPLHELKDYAGNYEHPGYGTINVRLTDGALNFTYNASKNTPIHHHNYETFSFTDPVVDSIFRGGRGITGVTFRTGMDGSVESIVLPLEPSVDPIVFKKQPTINEYTIRRTVDSIKLDGALNEITWKNAVHTDNFVIHNDGSEPTYKTTAQLAWDNDNLYVAFTVEDPDIWATMEKHDEYLWTEEAVEIYLDPDGDGRNYLELQANALGTTLDLLMSKAYASGGSADFSYTLNGFKAGVDIKGTVNKEKKDKGWTCEIALPFRELASSAPGVSMPPEDGDSWRLNLCRIESGRGEKKLSEAASWNKTDKRGYHAPDLFGKVFFSMTPVK